METATRRSHDDMALDATFGMTPRSKSMLRARKLYVEAERLSEEKRKKVTSDVNDKWRATIRREIEENLSRQVREALSTPPLERLKRNKERSKQRYMQRLRGLNSHVHLDLTEREKEYLRYKRVQKAVEEVKARARSFSEDNIDTSVFTEDIREKYERLLSRNIAAEDNPHPHDKLLDPVENFSTLSRMDKKELYFMFTKRGFLGALRRGSFHNGSELESMDNGRYRDRYGIVRDMSGPFWPPDFGPLFPAPEHARTRNNLIEPIQDRSTEAPPFRTHDNQTTCYNAKWRGAPVVFDSETSGRFYSGPALSEGFAPSLSFESRFECGNLRQVRRIGQFEYELVLQTDLYTKRHTQWYYFRVENMMPGFTYKFIISNLLKPSSLYNNGMRPVSYSERNVKGGGAGWTRVGHHINYGRNVNNLHSSLLLRDRSYYMLEFQMEFDHGEDACYLAHCYPYTFTDLRSDLDWLRSQPERDACMEQETLCETRAGNSCFLLTVTNFGDSKSNLSLCDKKCVVVSGRVHPGESNASWMMKGLIDFITSSDKQAKDLRDRYVFKIVPMLNPDGVIVGNYRCSLMARDLNRNYRHPRQESFPTIWHTKNMVEEQCRKHEVVVYCDFHGHSRKHNVFMYGCNDETVESAQQNGESTPRDIQTFVNGRLFPWLMSTGAPDKFSFSSCKFRVRRCKESTGRVVMWRQMGIDNSFTMEASFSGSNLQNESVRHFNTEDLESMGRVFCQSVMEHQRINSDQELQAATVIEITKSLVLQLANSCQDPALQSSDFMQKIEEQLTSDDLSKSGDVTAMLIKLLAKDKPGIERQKTRILASNPDQGSETGSGTGSDVINGSSMQAIENCFRLLGDLRVVDLAETDSSDSDSESEPEMQHSDPRKKKKKKSKKKRDQEKLDRLAQRRDSLEIRDTMTLPAIAPVDNGDDKQKLNGQKSTRPRTKSLVPLFISKFEGRHNNGIPCFSEERIAERATKKYSERQKRNNERRQREAEIYLLPQKLSNYATVVNGDCDHYGNRQRTSATSYVNRLNFPLTWCAQLTREGAEEHVDDVRCRQVSRTVSKIPPHVTRAFMRWRDRCTKVCPTSQDDPMKFSSLQIGPMDYAIEEECESFSNPDSQVVSESEEDFDYFPMIPPIRRRSLPGLGKDSYRFSLVHRNDTINTDNSSKIEEDKPTTTSVPLRPPERLAKNSNSRKSSNSNSNGNNHANHDHLIKDMIIENSSRTKFTDTPLNTDTAVHSNANDVMNILQSVTCNANKSADLSQSDNREFFMVNNRLGHSKTLADITVGENKYRKARKNVEVKVERSKTSVDLTDRWRQVGGEVVYSSNLLKPCQPLSCAPYVPIPSFTTPTMMEPMTVDNKSIVKLLRARVHTERNSGNSPKQHDT